MLIDALLKRPVEYLDLSSNAFGPMGIVSVEPLLQTTGSLRILNLNKCALGPEGTEKLVNALLANNDRHQIESLEIRENGMYSTGASHLARLFTSQSTLKKLDVSSNNIESELASKYPGNGFLDLLPALHQSAESGSLEYLNIENNNLAQEEGTEGVECLI